MQNLAVRLILRRRGMDFERAESPRKGDMLFGRDELVAKEDDLVSEQRGANFSDRRVILFAGKVDPRNFGADPGSQRRDFQTDKRSEERRVRTECVRTGKSRWSPSN